MLPKENRLVAAYDFRRVRRWGQVYKSPFFVLVVAPRRGTGPSRFGFVIGKKFDKRATVRNRFKRLLREAVRLRLAKIPTGFDLIFIARPAIKGKSYAEISLMVDQVLSEVSFTRSRPSQKTFSDR